MKKQLIILCLLLFGTIIPSIGQDKYTPAEAQEFYRQVLLTKEYKALKKKVDSVNANTANVPQKLKFEIVWDNKMEGSGDYTLEGRLSRNLSLLSQRLEIYTLIYDRKRKIIKSISGGVTTLIK